MKNILLFINLIVVFFSTSCLSQDIRLVKDLIPGTGNGVTYDAETIISLDDIVVFENGELSDDERKNYVTDGTKENTYMIFDSLKIRDYLIFSDTTLFLSCSNYSDYYLIKYNKSDTEAKEILKDWDAIYNLTLYKEMIYFTGRKRFNDAPSLFKYNPLNGEVSIIFNLSGNYFNTDIIEFDNFLYLIANYKNKVYLMKSDGKSNIPDLIYQINTKDYFIYRTNLKAVGNHLFFWYKDDNGKYNLYRSDGKINGTTVVSSSFIDDISDIKSKNKLEIGFKGKYYFSAALVGNQNYPNELNVSDGTTGGTKKIPIEGLPEIYVLPQYLTIYKDELYVYGKYSNASWSGFYGVLKLNENTMTLSSIFDPEVMKKVCEGYGEYLTIFMDSLVFVSGNLDYPKEIWISNPKDKTYHLISDIYYDSGITRPTHLTPAGDKLFFFAEHPEYGHELYVYSNESASAVNDKNMETKELIISPNPAENIILFDVGEPILSLEIYNIISKKVLNQSNVNNNELSIGHLVKGIYFAKVKTKERMYAAKFIKI